MKKKTQKPKLTEAKAKVNVEAGVRRLRRKVHGEYHPCACDAGGNGGQQCYNCLNGAHRICESEIKCNRYKKRRGKEGVMLSFNESNA